ncbi:choice-of-anchor I domain-containing protein [Reinekea blandensis]|uniref:Alkaline phosphatase-like protein n=1 Tax=Reinekea blandensis MED297 TaxID=314283 RepID=A4BFW0_9GAMM|nr:hypothetical protein [Reinekea blandensis]EAR08978.1 alkaline phosphatase-like protein [Reinekea sp. MED297] [Reinekea blandensis MED297]
MKFPTPALSGPLSLALAVSLTGCALFSNDSSLSEKNPDLGGGQILLFTLDGQFIDAANVGHLPDMVTFIDNRRLMSANEGEPSDDYQTDPEGSVSLIDLSRNGTVAEVKTLTFNDTHLQGNVRIKPETAASVDLEPEYIAVSPDGQRAWVSLQENNAIAIVDLKNEEIVAVKDLGLRPLRGQRIDITDDGAANPVADNPANLYAMYQPDTLAAYQSGGQAYLVSANEGDDRDYDGWEDLEKVKDLERADGTSALSATLQNLLLDTDMKSLRVVRDMGMNEAGTYMDLVMTGTRSFSIWDEDGNLVFDSGSAIEDYLAQNYRNVFNTRVDDTDDPEDIAELDEDGIAYEMVGDTAYFWEGVDARSLKKGAEPEALALATINDRTYAYLGLEKQGGFMVFDITNPTQAELRQYFNDINYGALPSQAGDLAPEGMVTFEQDGQHYLAVAHELSSTVALFALSEGGTVSKISSLKVGNFGEGAAEILAYSARNKALYVTNGEYKRVDILDLSNPANLRVIGQIDFSDKADSLQSVAVRGNLVAIAVE